MSASVFLTEAARTSSITVVQVSRESAALQESRVDISGFLAHVVEFSSIG